jgi:hypothetical protein
MTYSIYNTTTGQIISVTNRTDSVLPDGFAVIAGRFDSTSQYIDNQGQVQSLPPEPEDANNYKLDWTTRTWIAKTKPVTEQTQRQQRDALLTEIDSISATRYASLTTEQQTELQQYRQALLDVPQQTGFPESVTWPSKPTWL